MKMSQAEWQTLLKRLRDNDASLTNLNLSLKEIGDAEVEELGTALETNCSLEELSLGANQIGDAGAKKLATVLRGNCTITKLNLRGNQIGDAGIKDLAIELKTNRSLIVLNLRRNTISDVGAKEFAIALKGNFTLNEFYLNYGINDTIIEELNIILQRNVALRDKMHEAIKKGNISAVNQYLQQGVSLLAVSGDENNIALHWAVIAKQPQMTVHLLYLMRQQGMPVDKRNNDSKTAADLAKGTKLEALFTSATPILSRSHNLAYTASQAFMPPPKNKASEIPLLKRIEYILKSKL